MVINRLLVNRCITMIAAAMVVSVAAQESRARIDVRVGVAPTPFSGSDGRIHLAYELIVTGLSGANRARFERVEVFGESGPKPLISYGSRDLDQRDIRPEADPKLRYGPLVPSGTTALIHVWITLGKDQAGAHRFGIRSAFQPKMAPRCVRVTHASTFARPRRSLLGGRFVRVHGLRTTDRASTSRHTGAA